MSLVSSSYLCRNSVGTYCFQRRIPLSFRQSTSGLPELVRLSLHTHSKAEAKRLARLLEIMFDLNADSYLALYDAYQDALQVLAAILRVQHRTRVYERGAFNRLGLDRQIRLER